MAENNGLPLIRLVNAIITKNGDYVKLTFADGEGESVIYRNACLKLGSGRKYDAKIDGANIVLTIELTPYKEKKKTATKPANIANDDIPF